MPVKDEFAQDHPLPVFLTGDSERFDDDQGSSLILKMSLLVVATIAIGVAMTLALGLPKSFFADARPTDPPPAARVISDQSAPPNQSAPADQSAPSSEPTTPATADTAPTLASAPPASETTASTPDSASDTQAAAPASAELLKQFQSWAATQDAQAPAAPAPSAPAQVEAIRPIQQNEPIRPIQDATQQGDPAPDAPTTQIIQENATPPRPVHKHHKPPATQSARAEIGTPKAQRPARTEHNARAADARAPQQLPQDQPPQPTQPPSLFQSLGLSRQ